MKRKTSKGGKERGSGAPKISPKAAFFTGFKPSSGFKPPPLTPDAGTTASECRAELARVHKKMEDLRKSFHIPVLTSAVQDLEVIPSVPDYVVAFYRLKECEDELKLKLLELDEDAPAPSNSAAYAQNSANSTQNVESHSTDHREMVKAYIEEVRSKTGRRITKRDIWSKAGYQTRTEFERWERQDSKRPNKAADENFTRILREKPHLK